MASRLIIRCTPAVTGFCILSICVMACSTHHRGVESPTSGGRAAPAVLVADPPGGIDFGVLRPGEVARSSLTLRNDSGAPIRLVRVATSCDCVAADETFPIEFAVGQQSVLSLMFDGREDPGFRGGLSVEIVGKQEDGGIAFTSHVHLQVRN